MKIGNKEKLLPFQKRKIKKHLNYITKKSGYYSEYRGKELKDFPVIDKKILMENFDTVNYNAQMSTKQIREFCKLDETSLQLLKTAMERLNLSARAYDRILKVSRTIADLEATPTINSSHIAEAIQYRSLDRDGWLG